MVQSTHHPEARCAVKVPCLGGRADGVLEAVLKVVLHQRRDNLQERERERGERNKSKGESEEIDETTQVAPPHIAIARGGIVVPT